VVIKPFPEMKTKPWQLALLLALAVTTIVTTVPPEVVYATSINDKVAHITTFLLIAFLSQKAFPGTAVVWKVVSLFAYGLLIECIQLFTPFREFSLLDQVANSIGILLFFLWHHFKAAKPVSP
jgi:VanZ family protein